MPANSADIALQEDLCTELRKETKVAQRRTTVWWWVSVGIGLAYFASAFWIPYPAAVSWVVVAVCTLLIVIPLIQFGLAVKKYAHAADRYSQLVDEYIETALDEQTRRLMDEEDWPE